MPKGRLLVVDRNQEFLAKTRDILREAGYEMVAEADGNRALAAALSPARGREIDGVISHFAIDGIDGTDLAHRLRERDPTIPCYLTIPHDDDELVEQCLGAGARNVLVRPLKRTELLFAARSMMNLRSLLRDRGGEARARTRPPPPPGSSPDQRASFFQFELFKRLLAIELKRAKRYGFSLAVMLVAPDGEALLPFSASAPVAGIDPETGTIVGRAVAQAIRDIDIPMHFADDTIMVVMPHTDGDGARVVAERVRRKARASEGAITVSIGVTSMEGRAKPTYAQLVARANKALREARRGGGDGIAVV